MTGDRDRMPARRRAFTRNLRYAGQWFAVSVGVYDDGRPGEVFCTGPKTGTDMAHTVADACVIISIALQYGIAPGELARSLGTVPAPDGSGPAPASIVGALMAIVTDTDQPPLQEMPT